MRILILSILLAAVSPMSFAWERISPNIQAIYGEKIDDNDNYNNVAEIVYDDYSKSFGISFIADSGERETLDYAIFDIKRCKHSTTGAIAGPVMTDVPSKDRLNKILLKCKTPILLKVTNNNNTVTYKFDDVGTITEK